ncbi:DUF1752-domain-containing protein [Trichocladium antarcticum]|uniref:DUF1752-domain-containing protein n=1 Tax=Trichocladium antarcticum TaxID=1450529 RepID=A0AAN6ULJ0_9PEZI|nr:DUF1752-domain-containing protein [Trichocladium antarcticum]
MPLSLEAPVLQVDANVIHKVDTTNAANLFSMWTVFARCRDSVAQGRRLENLSWRLWNRETFCCDDGEFVMPTAMSQPQDIQYSREPGTDDLPELSGSVGSLADEEAVDLSADSAPLDFVRPRIQRQDSCASSRSRGRERHITSDELEKMVVSIMEKQPLDSPLPTIPRSPAAEKPAYMDEAAQSGSTTSESLCEASENPSTTSFDSEAMPESETQSRTIVTRGFSPSQLPRSLITSQVSKSPSPSAIPQPTDGPAPKIIFPKKQQAKFALGGSSGSDEDSFNGRRIEARKEPSVQPRMKMFLVGGSPDEDSSPKSALQKPGSPASGQKKTASFGKQVVTQTYNTSAISDTETDDYYDESAIDDDEDWEEDEVDESGEWSGEEKLNFKRVDSSANLTSRRSLITLMLANNSGRTQRLANTMSHSTSAIPRTARASLNGPGLVPSPNDSDEAPLMMKRGTTRAPPMRPINEIPRSAAQPINAVASGLHYQAALSPRTTRRNMLATELTESLRRNLLRERSQKSSTANAVLRRRHTSHDVANLKQYPERPFMKKREDGSDSTSWDQYFKNPFAGYQAQAW